jgi:BON domain
MRHDRASPTVDPMDEHDRVVVDAVLTEFDWEPSLDASRVRVLAADGIVFLHGKVRSLAERWAASRAGLRASGVLYVHNELEIALQLRDRMSDEELTRAALRALQSEP